MGNHVLLHQTFSWSCFCERNIGKILINVEENTSFLELAALVSKASQSAFDLCLESCAFLVSEKPWDEHSWTMEGGRG